ncbi:DUF6159 family protein [Rubinisphaera sp.]|uniref:DUF6159 family protein n=1 Tax=Rubinisphaera sp. TaxID=2024857 RepID=UPI000C109C17|nr:DUF6159 family protein [Rubinisphaera sp.]MBV09452.1 hypothetical protein [Rubinisphaera sp.]
MFQRLSNGWSLAKQSWRVLMLDKELLVFPVVSGFCCLLVLASFIVPLFATGYVDVVLNDGQISQEESQDPIAYIILFAFYFVNYFVIVFFNSALVACAIIRFKGGDPTVADGFRASMNRLPQIAGWAFLSATVGVILKVIESRSEKVGQIVAGLLGAAWSVTTYFVVPILVVEKAGPIDAFKRSVSVLKKTWGESLSANFGIGFISFLATIACFVPIGFGIFFAFNEQLVLGGVLVACGVFSLILVSLITATLNSIIIAALYLYASEGEVPTEFDNRLLKQAFVNH